MSTAPQGWQNPRTNWQAADIVHPSDFNRIEGDLAAIETGQRTLDPSQVPSGNSGSLRQLLDWFANRIRAITGASNWYDSPATTLAAAKSHMDSTSGIHGATSSATANRLIIRDSNGRASVADPTSSSHIATKGYVDGTVSSHANATSVHGATSSATANRLVIRDSAGRAQFANPSAAQDAATKAYVDSRTNVASGQYTGNGQANRLISLGWRPRCVILFANVSHPNEGRYYDTRWEIWDGASSLIRVRWTVELGTRYGPDFELSSSSSTLQIRDNGFSVWASSLTNVSGTTYRYIAFRS